MAGYTSDLKFLIKGKSLQDPFFSSALKLDVAIARETFDRELNNILKSASARLGKHLRTHSFRATLITDLLENTPIDVVKDFIGHQDIKSTLTYKRSRLSVEDHAKVLHNLDLARSREAKDEFTPLRVGFLDLAELSYSN